MGDSVSVINLEDKDTFWIYVGNSDVRGLHIKEYFKRVPSLGAVPNKRAELTRKR